MPKLNKKFIKGQKELLEIKKKELLEHLSSFAKESKNIKGDWVAKYPKFDSGDLESGADEFEEYGNILPVSYTFEIELRKINQVLDKIKQGKYGICEKCKQAITQERLEAYPQAQYCVKCK